MREDLRHFWMNQGVNLDVDKKVFLELTGKYFSFVSVD